MRNDLLATLESSGIIIDVRLGTGPKPNVFDFLASASLPASHNRAAALVAPITHRAKVSVYARSLTHCLTLSAWNCSRRGCCDALQHRLALSQVGDSFEAALAVLEACAQIRQPA